MTHNPYAAKDAANQKKIDDEAAYDARWQFLLTLPEYDCKDGDNTLEALQNMNTGNEEKFTALLHEDGKHQTESTAVILASFIHEISEAYQTQRAKDRAEQEVYGT